MSADFGRRIGLATLLLLAGSAGRLEAKDIFVPITNKAGLAAVIASAEDGDRVLLQGGVWTLSDPGIVQVFADDLTIASADASTPARLVGGGVFSGSFFENGLFVVDGRVERGPRLKDLEAEGFSYFLDLDPGFAITFDFGDPASADFACLGGSSTGASIERCTIMDCDSGVAAFGDFRDLKIVDNAFAGGFNAIFLLGGSLGVGCGVVTPRAADVHVKGNTLGPGANIGITALNGVRFNVHENAVTGFPFGMIVGESHPRSLADDENGDGRIDDQDSLGANPDWGVVHHNDVAGCGRAIVTEAATTPAEGGGPTTEIRSATVARNRIASSSIAGLYVATATNGFDFVLNEISGTAAFNCAVPPHGDVLFRPGTTRNTAIVSAGTTICDEGIGNEVLVVGKK